MFQLCSVIGHSVQYPLLVHSHSLFVIRAFSGILGKKALARIGNFLLSIQFLTLVWFGLVWFKHILIAIIMQIGSGNK